MGNFSSQYFEEWIESNRRNSNAFLIKTENKNSFTPPNKRYLPTDPRSPSSDIRRTPIAVDKTPKLSNRSFYTALASSDKSVDENESMNLECHDSDEVEAGEEVKENTSCGCDKVSSCCKREQSKTLLQCSSSHQRLPFKMLSKRDMDSPVMYLRYKQMQELREGYSNHMCGQIEMSDVARNEKN